MRTDRIVDDDVAAWLDALACVPSPPFASLTLAEPEAYAALGADA